MIVKTRKISLLEDLVPFFGLSYFGITNINNIKYAPKEQKRNAKEEKRRKKKPSAPKMRAKQFEIRSILLSVIICLFVSQMFHTQKTLQYARKADA